MPDELEEFDLHPETGPWPPARPAGTATRPLFRRRTSVTALFALLTVIGAAGAILLTLAAGRV